MRAIEVTLLAVLLALWACACRAGDIVVTIKRPPNSITIRCPNGEQAQRKIAQGNYWGLAVNSRGTVHASGAVRTKEGLVWLVDSELQDEMVRAGETVLCEAQAFKERTER